MSRREFALGAVTAVSAGSVLAAGVVAATSKGALDEVGEVAQRVNPIDRPGRRAVQRAGRPGAGRSMDHASPSSVTTARSSARTSASAPSSGVVEDLVDGLDGLLRGVIDDPGVVDLVPDLPPGVDVPRVVDGPPLLTGAALVAHVARRLTFGPTAAVVDEIQTLGPAVWIERQLQPDLVDDTAMDSMLADYQTLGWTNAQTLAGDADLALDELRHATLLRAVASERQLLEVMVDFWTNHLNTYVGKGRVRYFKTTEDRDVIRRHAVGSFSDLLVASAKSPAMLEYLDNASSRGASPNENYGRELLELHTVGVDGGYTEDDVRGVAYVLTGWTVDRDSGEFAFRDDWHFDGPATVLGWSTPGRGGAGAIADGEALLAHLARHPSTARFLATKLAHRFIGDDAPDAAIESTAAAYLAADTDIASTLRHLFETDAFRGGGSPKFRRPVDLVASTLRSSGAVVDPTPRGDAARRLDSTLRDLGQRLFDQPPPTGYPEEESAWVSTDGLLRRWSWSVELLTGRIAGVTTDPEALAGDPSPATAGALVDRLFGVLHRASGGSDAAAVLEFLGVDADDPVTDEVRADIPLAAALVFASATGQYR